MARLLVTLLVLAIPVLGGIVHHASLDGLQDPQELDQLVVTTANPEPLRAADIVPLDSSKERSRFLVTLLMLQSLHDAPSNASTVDPKLEKQLLADEEVMQEVLKLYETTQETKGKHYIKIPPKLMKKMRRTMKELLSD